MFEVLAFVYENYWRGDACPEFPDLQRKLSRVGFEVQEIQDALMWLEDLNSATHTLAPPATTPCPSWPVDMSTHAMRVLTPLEQRHLGTASWGYLTFLMSTGELRSERLELVLERAMAAPGKPVSVADLKLIVLMMYWSLGEEPSALVLDELCDNRTERVAN